ILRIQGRNPLMVRITVLFAVMFVQMSVLFLIPLYLVNSHGYSLIFTGLVLTPGALGASIFMLIAKRITLIPTSKILITSGLLMVITGCMIIVILVQWPILSTIIGYCALAFGFA